MRAQMKFSPTAAAASYVCGLINTHLMGSCWQQAQRRIHFAQRVLLQDRCSKHALWPPNAASQRLSRPHKEEAPEARPPLRRTHSVSRWQPLTPAVDHSRRRRGGACLGSELVCILDRRFNFLPVATLCRRRRAAPLPLPLSAYPTGLLRAGRLFRGRMPGCVPHLVTPSSMGD